MEHAKIVTKYWNQPQNVCFENEVKFVYYQKSFWVDSSRHRAAKNFAAECQLFCLLAKTTTEKLSSFIFKCIHSFDDKHLEKLSLTINSIFQNPKGSKFKNNSLQCICYVWHDTFTVWHITHTLSFQTKTIRTDHKRLFLCISEARQVEMSVDGSNCQTKAYEYWNWLFIWLSWVPSKYGFGKWKLMFKRHMLRVWSERFWPKF